MSVLCVSIWAAALSKSLPSNYRWYSPGETYFRVLTDDGDRYVLRHTDAQDVWTLSAFRAETR